jgi:hypothetical protein
MLLCAPFAKFAARIVLLHPGRARQIHGLEREPLVAERIEKLDAKRRRRFTVRDRPELIA